MDINSPYLEPRPPPGGPPLLKSLLGRPMYLPGVGVCGRLVMEKSTLTYTDNVSQLLRMRTSLTCRPSSSWPSIALLASSACSTVSK